MIAAASIWARFVEYPFYQNALVAGAAVGLACAVLSVFVVQKRMAFIGEGIGHSAFAGVGIAMLLQLYVPAAGEPLARLAIIAASCIGSALVIGWLRRRAALSEDSAIGIALVAAVALGLVLINLRTSLFARMVAGGTVEDAARGYTPSFDVILYGSILSVSRSEVWLACFEAAAVVALVVAFFKELVFFTCDEEGAEAFGVPTRFIYYGLLVCISITIVVAMTLVGVILCSALLIVPGVIGGFWSRRLTGVLVAAALFAVGSVAAGLFLSIGVRVLSPGPLIVLVMCGMFGVSWAVSAVRGSVARRRR